MSRTGCGHIHCAHASFTIHESCYEPLAGNGEGNRPPIATRLQFRSFIRLFLRPLSSPMQCWQDQKRKSKGGNAHKLAKANNEPGKGVWNTRTQIGMFICVRSGARVKRENFVVAKNPCLPRPLFSLLPPIRFRGGREERKIGIDCYQRPAKTPYKFPRMDNLRNQAVCCVCGGRTIKHTYPFVVVPWPYLICGFIINEP